jgi:hypothetical protein
MRKNDPHIFGGRRSAGIINKRQRSKWSIAEFVLAMTLAAFFHLQSLNGASVEDVALLKSADRQKILVEGAKKEGKLSFYTTLIVEQVVRPLKDAFEKEYPFIQVEFFRGNSDRITQRLFAEYQVKRYAVDVVDGSSTTTMVQRAGYLQKFFSPHLAEYPAELKDPQGYWGVSNVYFHTLGYNPHGEAERSTSNVRGAIKSTMERADDLVHGTRRWRAALRRQPVPNDG